MLEVGDERSQLHIVVITKVSARNPIDDHGVAFQGTVRFSEKYINALSDGMAF